MSTFAENKAKQFAQPTQLPESDAQREEWLKANKHWWEINPMRYDWLDKIPYPEFTRELARGGLIELPPRP